jgi:hypothetical protein
MILRNWFDSAIAGFASGVRHCHDLDLIAVDEKMNDV